MYVFVLFIYLFDVFCVYLSFIIYIYIYLLLLLLLLLFIIIIIIIIICEQFSA